MDEDTRGLPGKARGGFSLALWNQAYKQWEVDPDVYRELHPTIPMMEEGWVFQYLSGDEWKPHGLLFPPTEVPSEKVFAECA